MAGGGSGGHVIPLLAVARELRERGHSVVFAGTDRGLESKLVPPEGFELRRIHIGALNRVSLGERLGTLVKLPIATLACIPLVRPCAAVFSIGGYVAGPPVMAALLARVPLVVMEPNAMPGFTNRVIGRLVTRALSSFPETASYFRVGRTETTGLPVREEFFALAPKPRLGPLQILITGGSQGSRTLNRAARQSWPLFRESRLPVRVVLQTGPREFEAVRDEFARAGLEGEVLPFISDMPAAFGAADLIVCRSGAGAVSELAAAGKPSILSPFPFAADDHQARNAEAMEKAGAARLVRDVDMTGEKLYALVRELEADAAALTRMGNAARQFAHPGAARRAAEILEEVG